MNAATLGFLFSIFSLFSCGGSSKPDKQLENRVDSLEREIKSLNTHLDSVSKLNSNPDVKVEEVKPNPSPQEVKPAPQPKVNPTPSKVVKDPNPGSDTTYYKYTNGKVSAKVTPWVNNRRKTILFDRHGKKTYEMEDVHLSYQITTRLSLRQDGSVEKASIHNNPGASMYWHETTITFDTDNEPSWKTEKQMPEHNLSLTAPVSSYWNKTTRQWVKQEAVEEQPVPH